MQIKDVKPGNFLVFRTQTTVAELVNYLPVAQSLYEEAVSQKLRINGAIHWHYLGFTGDLSATFTLEICLPIDRIPEGYDGAFHVKRTEPFRCISLVHEGSWYQIPESYSKMLQYAGQHNLVPVGNNREIYVNVDLQNPEANVTEIQLGLNGK
jgi:effector-binding domain-containing protein